MSRAFYAVLAALALVTLTAGSFGGGGFRAAPYRAPPRAASLPSRISSVRPSTPVLRSSAPHPAAPPVALRPLAPARAAFYAQHYAAPASAAPVYVSAGVPWWVWLQLYRQSPPDSSDRRDLEKDRREWTGRGECSRCHRPDGHW